MTNTLLPPPEGLFPMFGSPTPERRIIGLSGYAQAGKDTVAKMLGSRQYARVAFADPLRALAYELDPAVHDKVDMWGWEKAKAEPDGYVRRYLQKLGDRARAHLGPYVWIDAARLKVGKTGNYVFTDVRYRNEGETLRDLGGKLVRIERPGCGPANDHPTENDMDGYEFDAFINNSGDLNYLFEQVMELEARLF